MQFSNSLVVLASFLAATNALVAVPRDVDSLEARDVEARDVEIEVREPKKKPGNNNPPKNPPNSQIDGCSITSCVLAIVASGGVVGDCKGLAEDPTQALEALMCISSVAGAALDTKEQCRGCGPAANKNKGKGKKYKNGKPCTGAC